MFSTMCYSARQVKKIEELEKWANAKAHIPDYFTDDDVVKHHINGFAKHYIDKGKRVAPHPVMMIRAQENPDYLVQVMWGYVPRWEHGERIAEYYRETLPYGSGLNATSEKMFTSQMFRDSAEHRRCIVPVSGFYEPHTCPKPRNFKVPFHFERRDKQTMNLAGIYEFTSDGHVTFAILTKQATPLFEKVHNTKKRRPVILNDDQVDAYLDKSSNRNDIENLIANDMPDSLLSATPISKDLYSPKKDSNRPNITDTVHYPQIQIDYEGKPNGTLF